MGLPALEFLERAQVGVGIVQSGDEAQRDLVVLGVVEEGAAVGVGIHRPAGGVHHEAGLVHLGIDFPQLLHADAVGLRVAALVELVTGDDLLAQVPACAFGEQGVLGVQFHAQLEVARGLAVLAHAHVAGGHALDGAVLVVEHFGGREAREDLHAQLLRLRGQPAHHVAEADDVVAVVLEAARQQEVGGAPGRLLAQEDHGVFRHRLLQGRAALLPVGDEFGERARVHDGTRKDVRAGLGALLEHHHRHVLPVRGGHLLEPDGRREPGRAAADHDHVVFHGLSRTVLGKDFVFRHGLSRLGI